MIKLDLHIDHNNSLLNLKLISKDNKYFYQGYGLQRIDGFTYRDKIKIGLEMEGRWVRIWTDNVKLTDDILEKISLAISLVQGKKIKKFLHQDGYKIKIDVSTRVIQNGFKPIIINYNYLVEIIEKTVDFLEELSRAEYRKWKNAIIFLLAGRESNRDINTSIINHFTFIEIFKKRNDEFKKAVKKVLKVNLKDAKFIKDVRTYVVHEGKEIYEILPLLNKENLDFLKITGDNKKDSILFFYKIEELINEYIAEKIGMDKQIFNKYVEIKNKIK